MCSVFDLIFSKSADVAPPRVERACGRISSATAGSIVLSRPQSLLMRPPAGGDSSSWSRWWRSIARSEFHAIKMNKTGLPSLTASPPESESAMWEDAGLPHFAGLFFGIIFLLVLLTYVAKNFQQKAPKTSTISELDRWLQKSFHWGKFYSFKTKVLLYIYSSQNWIHFGCGFEIPQSL